MIIWMCFLGLWQHIRHVAENTACLISRQPGSKKKKGGGGGEKKVLSPSRTCPVT